MQNCRPTWALMSRTLKQDFETSVTRDTLKRWFTTKFAPTSAAPAPPPISAAADYQKMVQITERRLQQAQKRALAEKAILASAKRIKRDSSEIKRVNGALVGKFLAQLTDELKTMIPVRFHCLLSDSTKLMSAEDEALLNAQLIVVQDGKWQFCDEILSGPVNITLPSMESVECKVFLANGRLRFVPLSQPGSGAPTAKRELSVWQVNTTTNKRRPLTAEIIQGRLIWFIEVDAVPETPVVVSPEDTENDEMLKALNTLVDWSAKVRDGVQFIEKATASYQRGSFTYKVAVRSDKPCGEFEVIATRSDAALSGVQIDLPPTDAILQLIDELEDCEGALCCRSAEFERLATVFSSLMDCTKTFQYGGDSMLLCQNFRGWLYKILDMRRHKHGADKVELFFHGGDSPSDYRESSLGFSYLFSDPENTLHGPGVYGTNQVLIASAYHMEGRAPEGACMMGLCLVPTAAHLSDVIKRYRLGRNRTNVNPHDLRRCFPNGDTMTDAIRIADSQCALLLGELDPIATNPPIAAMDT